jgi:transcription antitermination factor NusA-like protein
MGDIITYDQEIVMIIKTALQSAGVVGITVEHISNGMA